MSLPEGRENWIIREARKRPSAERSAFLDGACAEDEDLRQRIEALLRVQEQADAAIARVTEADLPTIKTSRGEGHEEALNQNLGRYRLLEKVGEGGFGVVYVAEQKEPVKRRVALKIIKLGMDTRQVVARFEAERQALALMDHPNIAKVLDAGASESGRPYFVMELVRGIRITDYCDQEKLSTPDRLELFIKVCQAIRATKAEPEQTRLSHQAEAEASTVRQLVEAQKHQLYIANINLAQQAWDQNNSGRLRELLAQTADYPDRGFEWYYWQRQAHRELKVFGADGKWVNAVAFSPDGRRILTGGEERGAKVWDAMSGQELLALKGYTSGVSSVAFSSDGRRITTGGDDGIAKVWDAASGQELFTLNGHSNSVSVTFSPDGRRIATANYDQTVTVWDSETGQELLTLSGHSNRVWCVAFCPDGRRLATASLDGTARVWDATTGRELLKLTGHRSRVFSVSFSPDGRRITTSGEDGTAKVWDAASGKELLTLNGHRGLVWSAVFSPDGHRIATGENDGMARVWDAATGRELLTLKRHGGSIRSIAFSPDGRRILTASFDGTAKVWDADSGLELLTLKMEGGWVCWSAAFSPDGRRIVTGSEDNTAKVWEAATPQQVAAWEQR